jgi:hypothetical protein
MLHYDYCHEESQVGGKSGENGFGFRAHINRWLLKSGHWFDKRSEEA